MALQEGDFVRIDFTGSVTETGQVFDTTRQNVAQQEGIEAKNMTYEPIIVCIGQGHVLPGLDKELKGKEEEGSFIVELQPEDAFGKKDAKRIKLMPKKVFDKQKIRIEPGMPVTIDESPAMIKSISGNRVVVDFNHQLAGHEITYEVITKGKVTDVQTQVETVVGNALRAPTEITITEKKATITFPVELPEKIQDKVAELITETTKISEVEFETKQNA